MGNGSHWAHTNYYILIADTLMMLAGKSVIIFKNMVHFLMIASILIHC